MMNGIQPVLKQMILYEQYKLSVSQISHREEIDEGFGFVVENSKATLVKLIDFFEE